MAAAESGQLDVLKWLRANGCPWDVRTIEKAKFYQHFEVMQWAIEKGCGRDTKTVELVLGSPAA